MNGYDKCLCLHECAIKITYLIAKEYALPVYVRNRSSSRACRDVSKAARVSILHFPAFDVNLDMDEMLRDIHVTVTPKFARCRLPLLTVLLSTVNGCPSNIVAEYNTLSIDSPEHAREQCDKLCSYYLACVGMFASLPRHPIVTCLLTAYNNITNRAVK
jgi:hypothetical protein